jgi:uncharacterized protein YbgA (DUF1722 family)
MNGLPIFYLDEDVSVILARVLAGRGIGTLYCKITLIPHYVRSFNVEYLKDQVYLDPHPDELKLLNQLRSQQCATS